MPIKRLLIYLVPLIISSYLLSPCPVFAQNFDIANTYKLDDKDAIPGDIIISTTGKGFVRADAAYDSRILGIYQQDPVMVVKNGDETKVPIVKFGSTSVNVSDLNGEIQPGDYITTSPLPGKGMKAIQSGYVIGIATSKPIAIDQTAQYQGRTLKLYTVDVSLRVEYAELSTARSNIRLLNSINSAFFKNLQDPEKFTVVVRYIIAGIISLITLIFGFISITRSISKGIESIGRNPLAKKSIQLSMAFNIGIVAAAFLIVLVIDFVIIRF